MKLLVVVAIFLSLQTSAQTVPESFESLVKNKGSVMKITDQVLINRLAMIVGQRDFVYVQEGKILKDESLVNAELPYCKLALTNGYAHLNSSYPVIPDSMKQVGYFNSNILRFRMGRALGAECSNAKPAAVPIYLSDLNQIGQALFTFK